MNRRFLILLLFALLLCGQAKAIVYGDSAIYQGMTVRLDIANSILAPALSQGNIQSYEIGLNTDLLHRFYPTLEGGYAFTRPLEADGGTFIGKGGFFRAGLDLSMLRKHKDPNNALLIGIRVGSAFQNCSFDSLRIADPYWQTSPTVSFPDQFRADVWGEVVAGVQVQIAKGFNMGWYARVRFLFTRKGDLPAYYIPGYGYRSDMAFGFNYYLGWKF